MKKVITVKNLIKKYGDLVAVDDISFEVNKNEIFGIIGPNGAGKTTTVECIEGLRMPSEGFVRVLDMDPKVDSYEIKKIIGIQLQEGKFPDKIKVREVLELFASFYAHSLPIKSLLERVELSNKAEDYYDNLSGGQKQRLSIALALINDPEIVFFDELTTGLDPQARRTMWKTVSNVREFGKTVILVTHFMEEAERLCDRVAIIDHGKVVAMDTPSNLIGSIDRGLKISFSLNDSKVVAQLKEIDQSELLIDDQNIVIQSRDEKVISEIIHILRDNNCELRDFTVSRPTLEDVFLSITGEKMRE